MEILRGQAADKNDIIDFADYVFSKSARPHDFATLLPKLYGEKADSTKYHYIIKEADKIMATVCSYPTTIFAGDKKITVASIGTVSAHPRSKGKGYMKALMNRAVEDMKKDGITFSVLAGQRQRYEYFGYSPAGTLLTFSINKSNIRHAFGKVSTGNISVREAKDADVKDILPLYESLPLYAQREDFLLVAGTWEFKTYVITKQGETVGYMIQKGADIPELMLSDWDDFKELCVDIFSKYAEINITAAPWEREKIAACSAICEDSSCCPEGSFQVFDYAALFEALLTVKSAYTTLEQTSLILDIAGEIIRIEVSEAGKISAEKTDAQPDFIFTDKEAAEFLLSPMGLLYSRDIMTKLPSGWFPLPMYLGHADQI